MKLITKYESSGGLYDKFIAPITCLFLNVVSDVIDIFILPFGYGCNLAINHNIYLINRVTKHRKAPK